MLPPKAKDEKRIDGKTFSLRKSFKTYEAAKREAKRMAAKAPKKFRYRIIPVRGFSSWSTMYGLYTYTGRREY